MTDRILLKKDGLYLGGATCDAQPVWTDRANAYDYAAEMHVAHLVRRANQYGCKIVRVRRVSRENRDRVVWNEAIESAAVLLDRKGFDSLTVRTIRSLAK